MECIGGMALTRKIPQTGLQTLDTNLTIGILLSIILGLVVYLLMRMSYQKRMEALKQELVVANASSVASKTDFEARQAELRLAIQEIRSRELEAKAEAAKTEDRYRTVDEQLRVVLEEKGHLQNEAARVAEVKEILNERDTEIQSLNARITILEREKTEAIKDAEAAESRAIDTIAKGHQSNLQILKAKDEQLAKLNEFITQAREVLTSQFKALSADALKDVSEQLIKTADSLIEKHGEKTSSDVKLHQQQIENVLKPVEETIKRLDQHVSDSDKARSKAEALLEDQMKRLAKASESLTNALRKPVIRGSWGEMSLENALENAGLEAEFDFILQHTTDSEDGPRRTDAVINLPKGRKLIIDSKNLMESYLAFANAEDETQREKFADDHSRSLRNHIKALSAKEYWKRYEGLDCVILFIPHDGMYHAAIKDEGDLIREACEKRVFISNPMTLIPLLKAIRYVLDQERLNKSAEAISKVGAELYGEIARFAKNLAAIGKGLNSTMRAYNDTIPGLDHYILAKSRKLKELGAGKGADAILPESIIGTTRLFASRELSGANEILQPDEVTPEGIAEGLMGGHQVG